MARTIARLTVLSKSIDVERLAGFFEVRPAESWPAGHLPAVGVKRTLAGVRFDVVTVDGEVDLVRFLTPGVRRVLIESSTDLSVELSVVVYVSGNEGVSIRSMDVAALASVGGQIDIDVFSEE